MRLRSIAGILAALALAPCAHAQVQTQTPPVVPGAASVQVERVQIHGISLEGNLEGDSPDRNVIVYLPPSYAKEKARRYPVVYALHGFWIDNEKWTAEIHTPQTIEGAFALGSREMIVVLPNALTLYNGSMYSASVTTGDWENFIAHDVVAYIDAHYRTIPDRLSRGLAGHSMGGYGATRIGMKNPDVFGSLYIMSPCCLSARAAPPSDAAADLEKARTVDQALALNWMEHTTLAAAAAWSPNPQNPPLYFDLPTKDGAVQPSVLARWAANAPLAMLDQYVFNLRRYQAIAIDVGDQDGLKTDTSELHRLLDVYGIGNTFEIYSGTHTSAVADRFQNHVLPFFSRTLSFDEHRFATKPRC